VNNTAAEPQALVTVYAMVVVPAATPVTIPVLLMVATDVTLLAHVPPVTVLESVIKLPAQTDEGPVMLPKVGVVATVIGVVTLAEPHALEIV
jgi:hypothetical protein